MEFRTFSAVELLQQSIPSAPRFRTFSLEAFGRWRQPGRSVACPFPTCRPSGKPDTRRLRPRSGSAFSFRQRRESTK